MRQVSEADIDQRISCPKSLPCHADLEVSGSSLVTDIRRGHSLRDMSLKLATSHDPSFPHIPHFIVLALD